MTPWNLACSAGLVALLILPLGGCGTPTESTEESDKGISRVYEATFEQAWGVALTAFRWEGAAAVEEHLDERYMLASSGADRSSSDIVVGAWIYPIDPEHCKVTVATKRRTPPDGAALDEAVFHETFARGLRLLRSGEALSPDKPALPTDLPAR